MKENSKKILLFLYPVIEEERWISRSTIKKVVFNLSDAGFKSLLFLLEKNQLVKLDKTRKEPSYALSSYGKSSLEELFPALLPNSDVVNKDSSIIIFLESPKADKNFRYLRSFLTKNKAVALTRAVFIYPGNISPLVKKELDSSYRNAVLVMKVSDWIVGDEFIIMGQKAGLNDLVELYSGISKELEYLIAIFMEKKDPSDQQKNQLFSVFDRFLSTIELDSAFLTLYFPQVDGVRSIVKMIQKAFEI